MIHSNKGLLWLGFSAFKFMFEMASVFPTDLKRALHHFLRELFGRTWTIQFFFFFLNLDNHGKSMCPKEKFITKYIKYTDSPPITCSQCCMVGD